MAAKKSTTKKTKTSKAATTTKRAVATSAVSTKGSLSLAKLNVLSGITFLVLAVLAGVLMQSSPFETTISYLTQDRIAGGAIVAAYRHFMDIDLRWLTVGILVLAAIGPLLHATRMKQTYQKALKAKVMPWRWEEQGVLLALMTGLVAMLVGFQDLTTIKLLGISVLVIYLFHWYAEKAQSLRSHLFSLILTVITLVFLASNLLFTYVYGQIRASWFVYAAFAVLTLALVANSLIQYKSLRGHAAFKNYEIVERNYLVNSLVSKLAFALVLITGLAK